MIFRCILPKWAEKEFPNKKPREGLFTLEQVLQFNKEFYNIYFFPNYPSEYKKGTHVNASDIDTFKFVFADMDLKDGNYPDKDSFIAEVGKLELLPTRIVDSGNGVHAYWRLEDLDAMNYLRLQRRLARRLKSDPNVSKLNQLMRFYGTINTKHDGKFKMCELLYDSDKSYTSEQLDAKLPPITKEDEDYCQRHYNSSYSIEDKQAAVNTALPPKFGKLLKESKEARELYAGELEDRSKADYRLGHIMFAHGFTKEEAMSVLVNVAKALERAPSHRISYAENIVDKIWTYEITENKDELNLSDSVKAILSKGEDSLKGIRFPCHRYLDDTKHGFRLGQVIGLVAGVGVGKTAVALNMFMGFVQNNPDYDHFFVPLEQPKNEIADRWKTMCGDRTYLHNKVHVISNYSEDGEFRHLSFDEIRDYLLKFQKLTGKKVGCVVIDHIGALRRKDEEGENQSLMDICHQMKAFAIQTNTMLVMQSQAPREKAGIGDLELNKDAAYGTVYFESYCDYLITIWQPLKRLYENTACPTATAFKFCKIRHKKQGQDKILEDICYRLFFDPKTELLRDLTQDEETSFDHFLKAATNKRSKDRKTDLVIYTSIKFKGENDSNSEVVQ